IVDPNRITPEMVTAVQQAIFGGANDPTNPLRDLGLLKLSQTLVQDPPGSGKFFGLTVTMANSMDQLLRSLAAVGWDGTARGITQSLLARWKDSSVFSSTVQNLLTNAANAVRLNRSFQATVEAIYVHEANDLISTQLSDLEQALQNSQNTIDTLTTIQGI